MDLGVFLVVFGNDSGNTPILHSGPGLHDSFKVFGNRKLTESFLKQRQFKALLYRSIKLEPDKTFGFETRVQMHLIRCVIEHPNDISLSMSRRSQSCPNKISSLSYLRRSFWLSDQLLSSLSVRSSKSEQIEFLTNKNRGQLKPGDTQSTSAISFPDLKLRILHINQG